MTFPEWIAYGLSDKEVQWVTNDLAELGVKIGNQFFFLYKGESLVYKDATNDDGTPMHWRPVFKREFGECAHPINHEDPRLIGKVSLSDSDEWQRLPPETSISGSLEAVQRDAWISVEDERKPELGQVILMWVHAEDEGEDDDGRPFSMDKSQVQMGEYRDMGHGPFFDCFATPFADHEVVTHWQPLPPAPIAAAPQKGTE